MPPRRASKKNQLAVGIGIRLVRNVDIIKVMKAAGFDWLFLDLEHGVDVDRERLRDLRRPPQDPGIAPIVRVPYGELAMATRLLDGGALGIVIPHVDTAEEAQARSPTSCATRRAAIARWAAARRSSTTRR